jgi:hypothetical protein
MPATEMTFVPDREDDPVRASMGAWLAGALALSACTQADPRPAAWSLISTAIVQPRCGTAGCHSELARTRGLILDSREAGYRSLVTMPPDGHGAYVVAGDPGASALVYLLRGDEVARMPPDAPLPRADVELIERWIVDGAAP